MTQLHVVVVAALKVLGGQYSSSAEAKETRARLSTVFRIGEVFHARVNLNVASKVSPGKALTTQRHPRYPAAQGGSKRERSRSSL